MELLELVNKIKDKTAESKVDVSAIDPRVQATADGMVRSAKEELVKLSAAYRSEVVKNLLVQAASGPNSVKFAEFAAKGKLLCIDYHAVIDRIVNNMKVRNARDEFDSQEYWLLTDEIVKIRHELGITSMPMPTNNRIGTVYMKPLKEAVKNLIEQTYGQSLYSVFSRHAITNAALDSLFVGSAFPVVLYNCDGDVDQAFLPKPFATITVPDDVDAKFTIDTINQIKKQYKATSAKNRKDEPNE